MSDPISYPENSFVINQNVAGKGFNVSEVLSGNSNKDANEIVADELTSRLASVETTLLGVENSISVNPEPVTDPSGRITYSEGSTDTIADTVTGHISDTSNPHNVTAAQVGVNNPTVTVTGSGALGGSGSFTLNQATNASISISHDSKSVGSSSLSSPTNVITGLSFDSYGHVNSYQYTPAADLGGGGGGGVTIGSSSGFSSTSDGEIYLSDNDQHNTFIKSSLFGTFINGSTASYSSALPIKTAIYYDSSLAVPFQASSVSGYKFDGTLGFDNNSGSLTYFSRNKYEADGFSGTGWYEVGGGGGGGSDSYATILSSATLSNDVYFDSIDLSSQSTIDTFAAVTSNPYSPSFSSSSFYGNGGLSFLYYSMQNTNNGFSVSGSKNFLFSALDSTNDPRFNRPPSFYGLIDNANGSAEFNQNLVFATDGNGINGVNWSNASSKQIANNISIGSSNFYYFNYDSQFLRENVVVGKNNFDFANYYPVNGNVENNILIGTSNLTSFSCGRENGFTKLICIGNQNLQYGSDFSGFSSNYSAIVLGNGNQSNNLDNIAIIGNSTSVNGDNEFQLGNSLNTVYTHQAIQTRSDERDKTEIQDTVFGLDFVNRLRPVDFKWDFRSDYYYNEEYDEDVLDEDGNVVKTVTKQRIVKPDRDGSKKRNRFHCGLIAQDVKSTLDELGLDFGVLHDASVGGGEDVLTLGYTELVGPLIKAVQELTARVQQLETSSN